MAFSSSSPFGLSLRSRFVVALGVTSLAAAVTVLYLANVKGGKKKSKKDDVDNANQMSKEELMGGAQHVATTAAKSSTSAIEVEYRSPQTPTSDLALSSSASSSSEEAAEAANNRWTEIVEAEEEQERHKQTMDKGKKKSRDEVN
jgi:hypothetical protein